MYKYFYIYLIAIALVACQQNAQQECIDDHQVSENVGDASGYDSLYAEKLGADQYGMHPYVMAFLKAGPNRDQTEEEANELQTAHMENIGRLAESGDLVLAGPFMDDSEFKGIYIFDVKTVEEAEKLTKTDPAIQAGRLVMELHPWYGSAAVMEINEIHQRIAKINI